MIISRICIDAGVREDPATTQRRHQSDKSTLLAAIAGLLLAAGGSRRGGISPRWRDPARAAPPRTAVDVEFDPALRSLLATVLADRLALIVTHQVIDARVLADRVVVLDGGRVVEQGPTREVLNGTLVRVRGVGGLVADITPAAAVELGLHTSAEVWFVVRVAEVAVYPTNGSGGAVSGGTPASARPPPPGGATHPDVR